MGKLPVVKDHERKTPAEFQETGAPSQGQGDRGKAPRPPLGDSFGLVLYQLGLSFRKTAKVLGLLGKEVSHVAVWYWNKKVGEAGIKLYQGPLPLVIVVDETWVKVGGKEAWIYVALDPAP